MKINLEGKKYLVTSGCSFTDGFHMAEKGSWAFYLANKLGLELHNRAKGGQGNEFISYSVLAYLANNKEIRENCIVGIAWSEVTRLFSPIGGMVDAEGNPAIQLDTVRPQDFLKDGKFYDSKCNNKFFLDVTFCVYRTYMAILHLNTFLELHNIPYFYIDAINVNQVEILDYPYEFKFKNSEGSHEMLEISYPLHGEHARLTTVINKYMNQTLFTNFLKIDKHNTILDFMFSDYDKYERGNPGHPNDIASEEIAQIIYNQII